MSDKEFFFPNLNSLRFIAAFAVIIHHVEQTKWLYGEANLFEQPTVNLLGSLGVTLFFVLSGFLITFLLLKEKQKTGHVKIRKFYMRRILRIWPLYFLIVTAGLFLLPRIGFFHVPVWANDLYYGFGVKVILFALILPNVALILYPPMPYMKQTWSIGVEEQFYIIWPLIIKYSRNYLLPLFLILFAIIISTNLLYWITNQGYIRNENLLGSLNFLKQYLSSFRVGCMAIGGMMAYLLFFEKKPMLKILFSKQVQLATLILLVIFLGLGIWVKYIQNEFYSVLFAILILNMAGNKNTLFNIDFKIFDFLGKISYGLYMLHPIALTIAIHIVHQFYVKAEGVLPNIILYSLSFLFTIILSFLSYRYYERFFLKLKYKFNPA